MSNIKIENQEIINVLRERFNIMNQEYIQKLNDLNDSYKNFQFPGTYSEYGLLSCELKCKSDIVKLLNENLIKMENMLHARILSDLNLKKDYHKIVLDDTFNKFISEHIKKIHFK